MGWKRSWAENARGNVICPMVIAWSFNKTFLWSVLELIYLQKAQTMQQPAAACAQAT